MALQYQLLIPLNAATMNFVVDQLQEAFANVCTNSTNFRQLLAALLHDELNNPIDIYQRSYYQVSENLFTTQLK